MQLFDESTLEQAIIDKFVAQNYEYVSGDNLHRELTNVLIEEDLYRFLSLKYADKNITHNEIMSIIKSIK